MYWKHCGRFAAIAFIWASSASSQTLEDLYRPQRYTVSEFKKAWDQNKIEKLSATLNSVFKAHFELGDNSADPECAMIVSREGFSFTASHCMPTDIFKTIRVPGTPFQVTLEGSKGNRTVHLFTVILDEPMLDLTVGYIALPPEEAVFSVTNIRTKQIDQDEYLMGVGYGTCDQYHEMKHHQLAKLKPGEKAVWTMLMHSFGGERFEDIPSVRAWATVFRANGWAFGGDSGGPIFDNSISLVALASGLTSNTPVYEMPPEKINIGDQEIVATAPFWVLERLWNLNKVLKIDSSELREAIHKGKIGRNTSLSLWIDSTFRTLVINTNLNASKYLLPKIITGLDDRRKREAASPDLFSKKFSQRIDINKKYLQAYSDAIQNK